MAATSASLGRRISPLLRSTEIGAVPAPAALLIRPDGHVAWVGTGGGDGLRAALTRWCGPAGPARADGGSVAGGTDAIEEVGGLPLD
jgi:hypothetical protein